MQTFWQSDVHPHLRIRWGNCFHKLFLKLSYVFHLSINPVVALNVMSPIVDASELALANRSGTLIEIFLLGACLNHSSRATSTSLLGDVHKRLESPHTSKDSY